MPEEIGLFEAIYTQRAVRAFKPDPVPDEVIHKLIEAATKAPSGSNRQGWKFLVIRDVELKRKIGEYYNLARESRYGGGAAPVSNVPPRRQAASNYMAEHMHEVPVLILACIEHDGGPSTMSRGGSIYPAVQNLLLAARGLGLGSVITSLHKRYEDEVKALLGIPDNVETAALLPIGYPARRSPYGSTTRAPVEEVMFYDKWGATA
jgi:nitroreductase